MNFLMMKVLLENESWSNFKIICNNIVKQKSIDLERKALYMSWICLY